MIINDILNEKDKEYIYDNFFQFSNKIEEDIRENRFAKKLKIHNPLRLMKIVGFCCVIFLILTITVLPFEIYSCILIFMLSFLGISSLYIPIYVKLIEFQDKQRKNLLFHDRLDCCTKEITVDEKFLVFKERAKYPKSNISKAIRIDDYLIIYFKNKSYIPIKLKDGITNKELENLFPSKYFVIDSEVLEKSKPLDIIIKENPSKDKGAKIIGIRLFVFVYIAFMITCIVKENVVLPGGLAYRNCFDNGFLYCVVVYSFFVLVLYLGKVLKKVDRKYYKGKVTKYAGFKSLVMFLLCLMIFVFYCLTAFVYLATGLASNGYEVAMNPNGTIIVRYNDIGYNDHPSYSLWKKEGSLYRIKLIDIDGTSYKVKGKIFHSIEEVRKHNLKLQSEYEKEQEELEKKKLASEKSKSLKNKSQDMKNAQIDKGQNNREAVERENREKEIRKIYDTYYADQKGYEYKMEYNAKGHERAVFFQDSKVIRFLVWDNNESNDNVNVYKLEEAPKNENGEYSILEATILKTFEVEKSTGNK